MTLLVLVTLTLLLAAAASAAERVPETMRATGHAGAGVGAGKRTLYIPPLIRRLGQCETRMNWRHNSGTYQGFVGWYWGTWLLDRYPGMPRNAYQATPRQQVRVAIRSVARGRYFGCLNHAWVRG